MTPPAEHAVTEHVGRVWDTEILGPLQEYITIPALSPSCEPAWAEVGHIERAVTLVRDWCAARHVTGMTIDVQRLPGLTPLIVIDIPAFGGAPTDRTVILYGHLDKQPEMTGWRDDLGPWSPVIENGRLYGRGGADDGYSAFASLTAIEAVQAVGGTHARCVVLIEASEESGSPDLPAHLAALGDRLAGTDLVLCLDSGSLDYERLWVTTSLRGVVGGRLTIEVLTEGVHSGSASGVVPSSFRIIRQLLDRIEDSATGRILLPEFHVDIPADRLLQIEQTAAVMPLYSSTLPFVPGTRPMVDDAAGQFIGHTWMPTLSVVGADGLPPTNRAGNVLRPSTSLQLSLRIPPTCDPEAAAAALERALLADPPYGARVTFAADHVAPGWNAPTFAPWLEDSLQRSSQAAFGQAAKAFGEGGTIPFMGMLGEQFPAAQFVITGVLGPGSNAHGPNEFLHLATARRVTEVLAHVLQDHARS
jgi:acetylornithine deacetylase/succinyl-diaminopimelate desuccinylase-like protein